MGAATCNFDIVMCTFVYLIKSVASEKQGMIMNLFLPLKAPKKKRAMAFF